MCFKVLWTWILSRLDDSGLIVVVLLILFCSDVTMNWQWGREAQKVQGQYSKKVISHSTGIDSNFTFILNQSLLWLHGKISQNSSILFFYDHITLILTFATLLNACTLLRGALKEASPSKPAGFINLLLLLRKSRRVVCVPRCCCCDCRCDCRLSFRSPEGRRINVKNLSDMLPGNQGLFSRRQLELRVLR